MTTRSDGQVSVEGSLCSRVVRPFTDGSDGQKLPTGGDARVSALSQKPGMALRYGFKGRDRTRKRPTPPVRHRIGPDSVRRSRYGCWLRRLTACPEGSADQSAEDGTDLLDGPGTEQRVTPRNRTGWRRQVGHDLEALFSNVGLSAAR